MPTVRVSEPARAAVLIYFVTWWGLGVGAAQGFLSTLFAVLVPPYAWAVFATWLVARLS